ncbi:hypothetical protein KI387_013644, partial [Taxus chinensis]
NLQSWRTIHGPSLMHSLTYYPVIPYRNKPDMAHIYYPLPLPSPQGSELAAWGQKRKGLDPQLSQLLLSPPPAACHLKRILKRTTEVPFEWQGRAGCLKPQPLPSVPAAVLASLS